jgi:hypothetical protein
MFSRNKAQCFSCFRIPYMRVSGMEMGALSAKNAVISGCNLVVTIA